MTLINADVRRKWIRADGETLSLIECCVCYALLFEERRSLHYEYAHPGIRIEDPLPRINIGKSAGG